MRSGESAVSPPRAEGWRLGGRSTHDAVTALAIVAGIALIAIAVVYWAEPAGSLPSFFPGHEAILFLMRYFETRTLTPFAIYCAAAGTAAAIYFAVS